MANRLGRRSSGCLLPPGTPGQKQRLTLDALSQYKNQSRDDNPGLLDWKITRNLARALLTSAALAVSLLNFINSSGDSYYVGNPFFPFSYFFTFNSFDD